MGTFKIRTPDNVGREYQMPDEGQLFRDTGGRVGMIKGGQLLALDPNTYAGQVHPEYDEVDKAVRNYTQVTNPFDPTATQKAIQYTLNKKTYTAAYDPKTNRWDYYDKDWKNLGPAVVEGSTEGVMSGLLRAAGLGNVPKTGGERQTIGYKSLGIDPSKIPEWNPADWQAATGAKEQALTPELLKQTYGAGGFAPKIDPATGGERILSVAETPALISGEGGPKDAQGNLIKPEDYAKYGITDTKAAAPQTYVGGVLQGGNTQEGQTFTMQPGAYSGSTITDPATGIVYQSSGANAQQPNGIQTPTETPVVGEIDMTGWSQAQIDAYNASKDYVDNLAKQGQVVNPDIEISADIINKFTEQAKTELSPYYTQIFNQAKQDMDRASKKLADNYSSQERSLGEQYGKALEGTQESYARRGLSDSTMRTGAERELATQATRSLEELQKGTENAAADIGIQGERTVGSANMPSLGSYNVGARPVLSQAGVYGMTPSSQSRSLYTPQGGTTGTYEQERLTAEEQRKRDLIGSEREYRANFYA